MIKNPIILFLLFSLPVFAVADEICPTKEKNIPATTPTSQFDLTDNYVTDKKTGLIWARCPFGYKWGLGGCSVDDNALADAGIDDAHLNWQSALTITKNVTDNYLGTTGWRMPNIKELASIVERRCADLAMNQVVFGDTVPGKYWSNTHVAGGTSIRIIDFSSGQLNSASATSEYLFRLVKDVNP